MKTREQELAEMLEEVVEHGELNDWETNFIDSIADTMMREIPLTENQEEKLREIYRRVAS